MICIRFLTTCFRGSSFSCFFFSNARRLALGIFLSSLSSSCTERYMEKKQKNTRHKTTTESFSSRTVKKKKKTFFSYRGHAQKKTRSSKASPQIYHGALLQYTVYSAVRYSTGVQRTLGANHMDQYFYYGSNMLVIMCMPIFVTA